MAATLVTRQTMPKVTRARKTIPIHSRKGLRNFSLQPLGQMKVLLSQNHLLRSSQTALETVIKLAFSVCMRATRQRTTRLRRLLAIDLSV